MTTITLNKKEFIKVLNIGGTFAGRSKVMPILDCVKIKVSNGDITVVSSDNENAISKKFQIIETSGDTTFCVNFKDIISYIKLIDSDIIRLNVGENDVEVSHTKGKMTLPIYNADEFPALKVDDNAATVKMDSALLNNWIVSGKDFVSSDELRPQMTCIYFYCYDGEVGCCASDGYSLFTDNIPSEGDKFEFLLNKNSFKAVCDSCQDLDAVTVKIGEKNVMFVGDGISVLARKTENRYPNFKMVFPKESNIQVKVSKAELSNAINRVKVGASQSSRLVKISVSGMNMEVMANDMDFNRKAVENIMVDTNGDITIAFDANNILLAMSAITTEYIIMNFTDSAHACLIKEDSVDSNKAVLIMPMKMND